MRVRRHLLGLAAAVVIGNLSSCASKQASSTAGSPVRTTVDVPDHFMTDTPTGAAEPGPGDDCHNPLIDPRDGTRLTLIRSADGRGDYESQPLRYGLKVGELLRVDCASGRAVGIVKR